MLRSIKCNGGRIWKNIKIHMPYMSCYALYENWSAVDIIFVTLLKQLDSPEVLTYKVCDCFYALKIGRELCFCK